MAHKHACYEESKEPLRMVASSDSFYEEPSSNK